MALRNLSQIHYPGETGKGEMSMWVRIGCLAIGYLFGLSAPVTFMARPWHHYHNYGAAEMLVRRI